MKYFLDTEFYEESGGYVCFSDYRAGWSDDIAYERTRIAEQPEEGEKI